jgi:O-antigen/teichoic acid export membrane protein
MASTDLPSDPSGGNLQSHLRGAAAGTALILMGFAFYATLNVAFQFIIARRLSTTDVGRYFQATALVAIVLGLCTGGLPTGIVRFVAILGRDEALAMARGIVLADAAVAAVLGAVLWGLSSPLADHLFHDPAIAPLLRIASVALPLGVLGLLWAANARGWRAFRYHFFAEQIALPAGRLLFLIIGLSAGLGVEGATLALVMGFAASAAVGSIGALKVGIRPVHRLMPAKPLVARLVRFSAYRWGVDILQPVLLWADVVILGALRPSSVAGTYAIATRVVVFASVGLAALNLAIAPFIAQNLKAGRLAESGRIYELASRWASILTFLPLGLIFSFRHQVLNLFGHAFVGGAGALSIVMIGFLFNAACGPVGNFLDMSTSNRLVLWDSIAAVTTNVALNLFLIPPFGMVGAATAWSVSLVVLNVLMLYQVHNVLRVPVLQRAQVRTVLGMTAVLLAQLLMSKVGSLPAGLTGLVGFGVVTALTREPEEEAWVRSMLATVRGSRTNIEAP